MERAMAKRSVFLLMMFRISFPLFLWYKYSPRRGRDVVELERLVLVVSLWCRSPSTEPLAARS